MVDNGGLVLFAGTWDSGTFYHKNECVLRSGVLYQARTNRNDGKDPTSGGAYWTDMTAVIVTLTGTIDPTAGSGVPAAVGSTYQSAAGLLVKTGAGATDWAAPGGGATPTLAEVLAEGAAADVPITFPNGALDGATGSSISLAGVAAAEGISNAALSLGSVLPTSLGGADGATASAGQAVYVNGGYGNGGNAAGGQLAALGGAADGTGGAAQVVGGDAETDSDGDGGDITLTAGAKDGTGRDGLIFLNLPTTDPEVVGALYEDSITHVVTVSQGPT